MSRILKSLNRYSGGTIVEAVFGVSFLLLLVGSLWSVHSLEDTKKNLYGAIFRVFSTKSLQPFTTNSQGDLDKWSSGNGAQAAVIDPLVSQLYLSLNAGSVMFTFTQSPLCNVAIAYLNIDINNSTESDRGKVIGFSSVYPSIDSSPTTLDSAMKISLDSYVTSMMGKKINSEETKILLDADQLPQFLGASANPLPETIYFQWAPVFVWGCEGQISALFGLIPVNHFRWTGIFVPQR